MTPNRRKKCPPAHLVPANSLSDTNPNTPRKALTFHLDRCVVLRLPLWVLEDRFIVLCMPLVQGRFEVGGFEGEPGHTRDPIHTDAPAQLRDRTERSSIELGHQVA